MKINSFQVIAPDKRSHFKSIVDIGAKIFPDFGFFGMSRYFTDYYLGNSHYDWHVSRIGCVKNQIVTHWGVWGYSMRVGTATLKTAGMTGSAVRPTYQSLQPNEIDYYWCSDSDAISGYVRCDITPDSFTCFEAIGDPEQALRVVGDLARKNSAQELCFRSFHYDSPVAVQLRAGNCRQEIRYHANGGPMIRILNLASTLKKLCGEFSQLLKHSPFSGWSGDLLVTTTDEKAVLKISKGCVTVGEGKSSKHAIRAGKELAQLLIGTDDPLAIVRQFGIRLVGDARKLVPVLFPARNPMLSSRDGF